MKLLLCFLFLLYFYVILYCYSLGLYQHSSKLRDFVYVKKNMEWSRIGIFQWSYFILLKFLFSVSYTTEEKIHFCLKRDKKKVRKISIEYNLVPGACCHFSILGRRLKRTLPTLIGQKTKVFLVGFWCSKYLRAASFRNPRGARFFYFDRSCVVVQSRDSTFANNQSKFVVSTCGRGDMQHSGLIHLL